MSEQHDAILVSRVLDEGAGGGLEPRLAGQQRVHAALSTRSGLPLLRPTTDIGARVMMRIGAPRETRRVHLWPVGLAAMLTIAAGVGWILSHTTSPVRRPDSSLAGRGSHDSAQNQFAAVLEPLTRSDAAVHASLETPFLQQARFIREDTRQGMEMVLSRLPMGESLLK